jgi:aminoglycoside phosphotransferase family enzyme/predicted kinase
MLEDPQRDIFALLSDPATYGDGVERVDRIDTHISAVFLAGDRVYKLKRAVRLPFLDFSTLEQRHMACLAELVVNRRTAPELYVGLTAITREDDGKLALGGEGQPVDWLVVMVRFDQDSLMDHMAAAGQLTRAHANDLADAVAAFHAAAEPRPGWGGEAGIRSTIDSNAVCFAQDMPGLFDAVEAGRVTEGSLAWLTRLAPLLEARRAAGLVRLCHGDLHLGNICVLDGKPRLFDGIEFSDTFACIDVYYDLAFLLMDFRARGLPDMASWVLNRYLEQSCDLEGLAALPLFLSLRAAIRAHVSAAMARVGDDAHRRAEGLAYMDMAGRYLDPPPPRLMAVGGLSGSGKSRLGRDLAPLVGAAPGAVVLRTDVLRKRLMGVGPETRLPPEGYSGEMTERTYAALFEATERALKTGHSVIADAVFASPTQRSGIQAVATRQGVPFDGMWLEARPEVMRSRIEARKHNASDATAAVLDRQLGLDLGEIDWLRVDSSGAKEDTFSNARKSLHL